MSDRWNALWRGAGSATAFGLRAGRLVTGRVKRNLRASREAFRAGLEGRRTLTPDELNSLAECYGVLELPEGSNLEAVERAYKRLARRYHPDRFENDVERKQQATEVLKALNEARRRLRLML